MSNTDFFELPLHGFDELHQNYVATNMYTQEMNQDKPIEFAPHHHQKILDRTKIRTARKRDKSGGFTINSERFMVELEVVLTMPAFVSLFDSKFYTPEQFGFDSYNEVWEYYYKYFSDGDLVFVHKIIEVEG
jgi:hypothetical protein